MVRRSPAPHADGFTAAHPGALPAILFGNGPVGYCDCAADRAARAPPAVDDPRERSARAAERITALGQMSGGIVHDFRNVLAIIESGLRLAERDAGDPATLRDHLAGVREGVERGLRLTAQLLGFAKPHELELHGEDANACIARLALFLKYGAGPGVRVAFDLAPDIPTCLIDPPQFSAALLNLVVNARDAMPGGGVVRISTAACEVAAGDAGAPPPGTYLRVRVHDDGQGMSAETLRNIFDPYFTTKGEAGTGLGVPQVCAFMRLVGGHVRVMSEPGIGTSFDLLFPARDGARAAPDWRQLDRWANEGGAIGASDVRTP